MTECRTLQAGWSASSKPAQELWHRTITRTVALRCRGSIVRIRRLIAFGQMPQLDQPAVQGKLIQLIQRFHLRQWHDLQPFERFGEPRGTLLDQQCNVHALGALEVVQQVLALHLKEVGQVQPRHAHCSRFHGRLAQR